MNDREKFLFNLRGFLKIESFLTGAEVSTFNEATLHGTLPWTAEHERRSLLYRYSPKTLHFAGGTYQVTQPDWVGELTEAQQGRAGAAV